MTGLRLSYVHGASDVPLLDQTIGGQFDQTAARWPDQDAVIVPPQRVRWTYRELKRQVDDFAAGSLALGLQPGDRMGIWAPNRAEWPVAQFAAAKIGVVLVSLNLACRANELELALNTTACKALITTRSFRTTDYIRMVHELAPEIGSSTPGRLAARRVPSLRTLISLGAASLPGFLRFADVQTLGHKMHRHRLLEIAGELQFDDPISIQFTSGTTGAAKGVTLSHHSLLNNSFFSARACGLDHRDRLCVPVPLYHAFGMGANLCAVICGSTLVYPGEGFDPQATVRAVQSERCSVLFGAPTMFFAELHDPKFRQYDLASLRMAIISGSPCPIELLHRIRSDMKIDDVVVRYGMTENSPTVMMTRLNDCGSKRLNTVGRIHPHIEVKIIDAAGRIVPPGTAGELCVRGYSTMIGYWNDPARTSQIIDRGRWLHTGDIATLDDEGYCNIVGRLKDMVIRGGENIFPREIEDMLYGHPKIEQVHVVGVPDEKFGEELCAWIKLASGEQVTTGEIQEFCKGRTARHKVPRYIHFTNDFPMTPSGKIQKFAMRQRMLERLELHEQQTV
jgi:fatty-acyl-CoA synthase